MASIIARRKRRWKGKRWIDTPFAWPYKRRRMAMWSMLAGLAAVGANQIQLIKQAKRPAGDKAIAIGQAVTATNKAMIGVRKLF